MVNNKEKVFVPEVIPESSRALSIEEFSDKWKDFQDFVKSQLKDGVDYGKVPGIAKPFLMLPGAQKIMSRYITRPEYEVIDSIEDWDRELFSFQIKCVLRLMSDDRVVGEGIGSCNSFEEKYRYMWVTEKKLEGRKPLAKRTKKGKYGTWTEYKLERKDLASVHNTILKMAKKRAVVDASLTLSNASEYFTQDIEDMEIVQEGKIPDYPEEVITSKKWQELHPDKITEVEDSPITPTQIDEIKNLAREIGYKKLDLATYKQHPEAYHEDMKVFNTMKNLIDDIKTIRKERVVKEGFLKKYAVSDWNELHRVPPQRLKEMIDELIDLPLANEPEKIELKKLTKAEKIELIKDKTTELGYTETSPEVTSMLTPYGVFNLSQLVSLSGEVLGKILREEFGEESPEGKKEKGH